MGIRYRLSLEFAFHTWRTQREILLSDTLTTTEKSPKSSGEGGGGAVAGIWRYILYNFCCSCLCLQNTGIGSHHPKLSWHLHWWCLRASPISSWDICILFSFLHLSGVWNVINMPSLSWSLLQKISCCFLTWAHFPVFFLLPWGWQQKLQRKSRASVESVRRISAIPCPSENS